MKGEFTNICNRTVCDTAPAMWYNHSTRKYYCSVCAGLINEMNRKDAHELYGHELCTIGKPEES